MKRIVVAGASGALGPVFVARYLDPHLHDVLRFYIVLATNDAVAPAVGTKRIDDHFRRIAESRPV